MVEDASLWGREWSIPLPSGSGCHPPASLPLAAGRDLSAAGQLSFGIRSILCSVSWPGCELEPFVGKFSQVSSLRLSSGCSGWVLTLSTNYAARTSLSSPCSLVADASIWATSQLAVAVRHVFCGFLFFPLPVKLPSEIPKLLTDPPVRGFPTVWKCLLLHDSLPRTGLRP